MAYDLIGKLIVRSVDNHCLIGRINETEAYSADDEACHAFRGKTQRNASLFGPVGHAYVYFIYGNHFCLNAVAYEPVVHKAGGVLIRSIIPLRGIDIMQKNRSSTLLKNLTNGPGKLAQALVINKQQDGIDLTVQEQLYIADDNEFKDYENIRATPRIGLSKNKEVAWRFLV